MKRRKEYCQKYRDTHRDEIRESNQKYREKNKEKILNINKDYREKNKEKISQISKDYREKNCTELLEKKRVHNGERITINKVSYYLHTCDEDIKPIVQAMISLRNEKKLLRDS